MRLRSWNGWGNSMDFSITFLPEIAWPILYALGALTLAGAGLGLWRRLPGWALRTLALGVLVLALAGPQLKREEREGLKNIAFLVVDKSESTSMEDRAARINAAAAQIQAQIEGLSSDAEPLELRVVEALPGSESSGGGETDNAGTRLLTALDEAAAHAAPGQIAGAVLLSDGQIHDPGRLTGFPGPVHSLIAGERDGFDLALEAVTAPSFGIVGEKVTFTLAARAYGVGDQTPEDVALEGLDRWRRPAHCPGAAGRGGSAGSRYLPWRGQCGRCAPAAA